MQGLLEVVVVQECEVYATVSNTVLMILSSLEACSLRTDPSVAGKGSPGEEMLRTVLTPHRWSAPSLEAAVLLTPLAIQTGRGADQKHSREHDWCKACTVMC